MTEFDMAPAFDFAASMREAEAAAGVEPPAEIAEPEAEASPGRERNELGQFVAAEQVLEEAAPVEALEEPAAEGEAAAEAAPLLAGKYKSSEELERAYLEAQTKLSQRDEKAKGYDELAAQMEQLREQFTQAQQPQPQYQPITNDLIEDNPAAAAQLAYQQNNHVALSAAVEYWKEVDPFNAALWVSQKQMEQRDQAWQQRLEQVEQQFRPAVEASDEQQWARSYQQVAAKYPDLEQHAPLMSEIADEHPVVLQTLQSGTPDSKAKALEALYLMAKGRNAGTLNATEQEVAQTTADEAEAARMGAFVASAAQTSTPPVQTYEEQEVARLTDRFKGRQELWDSGWDRS